MNPARQRIHMKIQALLSSKDKSKKSKCRLLQFLFGARQYNVDPIHAMYFRFVHYTSPLKRLTKISADDFYFCSTFIFRRK